MNWAFVDYENVRSLESVNLANYQRVFIFCGPQNKSLKFDELPASGISRIELISVPTSSKNNVDFHLAFHLGVEHGHADPAVSFHVISNDKGYQGLLNHLELLGRSAKLVEPNAAKKAAPRKVASKKAASEKTPTTTRDDAGNKTSSGRKREDAGTGTGAGTGKEAAGKASSRTKSAGNIKVATPTKTVTKIKIKANRAAALSDAASKLFAQLQITGSNRPKTKTRVLAWLKSHVKSLHMSPEPSPESIFDEWKAAGMLSLTGSTISYPDA